MPRPYHPRNGDGSREYTARDLDGNVWTFGTYDPHAAA
jgi:hypothetical protein